MASTLLHDTSRFTHIDGANEWVEKAAKQANPTDKNGWAGWPREAAEHAKEADAGKLKAIGRQYDNVLVNGRPVRQVEADSLVEEVPGQLRWVEIKSGDVGSAELNQLERQMATVADRPPSVSTFTWENVVEWRVGRVALPEFKQGAETLAGKYPGIVVRIIDATGTALVGGP